MLNGGFGGDNSDGDSTPWAAAIAPVGDIVSNLFFLSMLLSAVVALASVIYRFIRSEDVERQQMKWFALSVSILTVGFTFDQVVLGLTSADGWRAVWVGLLVIQTLVVMAIAIIKYRIYEIDRLISRTVSYVLVVGSLALVFFAVVTSVTTLLPSQNSLAVAASTLAVAGLFSPLRARIQKWVDHRFNRARYDAQRVVDDYASGLRNETDLNQLTKDLTDLVDDVLQPSNTSIWIRD